MASHESVTKIESMSVGEIVATLAGSNITLAEPYNSKQSLRLTFFKLFKNIYLYHLLVSREMFNLRL